MHFLTFHSGTLVLFTLLTISYALPTIDYGSTSELIERDKTKPKPKPKTPVKKPDAAKSKTQATGLHDGQVPNNYKPKIHTRDIEGLDEILQARGLNMDSINDLDARDFHYDLLEARKGGHGAAEAIVDVVTGIVNLIKDKIKEDNEVRLFYPCSIRLNDRGYRHEGSSPKKWLRMEEKSSRILIGLHAIQSTRQSSTESKVKNGDINITKLISKLVELLGKCQ